MRIRTILASAAAPAALAAVLLGTAGQASAATNSNPNPGNGAVVITSQDQADRLMAQGTINKNVDVPAGANIQLRYVEITGNVSVEGSLAAASDTFDRNIGVNGGSLSFFNGGSHVKGNLSVTNSTGSQAPAAQAGMAFGNWTDAPTYSGGDPATALLQVDGNVTFTGDSGWVYIGSPMHVSGDFTSSGNSFPSPAWFNIGGLTVSGTNSVS